MLTGPYKQRTFNAKRARLCVLASSRAYSESTLHDPHTDTHVLILELPDCIIVAFRGTASLEDFLIDADFFTMPIDLHSDVRVHHGFCLAFKSVENRLKARLDEILIRRGKDFPIYFTGHSLGGALAILAAFYLSRWYFVDGIYTFGAPDVGNAAFAKIYSTLDGYPQVPNGRKTFCLVNACDPVPWLPPYRFGYRRVGRVYFMTGISWLKSGFKLPLAARWIAGLHQVFQNWLHGKAALLTNHHIDLYKTRVEALSSRAA